MFSSRPIAAAAENVRSRNSPSGSIGRALRASQSRNAANATAATA